jgi:hypothetical protein
VSDYLQRAFAKERRDRATAGRLPRRRSDARLVLRRPIPRWMAVRSVPEPPDSAMADAALVAWCVAFFCFIYLLATTLPVRP